MNANAVEWNEFAQLEEADACRLAMLLAMTASLDVEKKLIAQFGAHGARGAVTVISGFDMGSQNNTIRNIINMCLNKGLIEKKFEHVHPVAHAVLEATECTRATMAVGQNYCFKVAAVRKKSTIAVCMYGDLGMHEVSSHKTVGLGVQVLGE
ncbi:MAG: HutP family protein [Pyramidobacter sp.]|nr:HutP family protein [Pyramidobacter sp.]MBP3753097.1 HutP family protein [Pyramidobacter sp.]